MWHSIKIGLFIGITTSSLVVFFLRIIPMTPLIMIAILYLYAIVGAITGFFVHKRFIQKSEKKVEEPRKTLNPSFGIKEYRSFLNTLNDIKTTALMIQDVIVARKRLDRLKTESSDLLGLSMDRMSRGISSISHEILSAKTEKSSV